MLPTLDLVPHLAQQPPLPHLGEILALGSAVSWAAAVIFFKKSGETMAPMALNLFKTIVALVPLLITVHFTSGLSYTASNPTMLKLFLGGVAGIGMADTLFFAALTRLGASRAAIINTLYSPIMVLLAYGFLGETLTSIQLLGGAMIVFSVVICTVAVESGDEGTEDGPSKNSKVVLLGVSFQILQLLIMGLSLVPIKDDIEAQPLLWGAAVRIAGGALALTLTCLIYAPYRKHWKAFIPNRTWRYSVPGSLLGTYVAMVCWMGGFKYTDANKASLLNQTATLFTVVFAWLFLKEPLTRRRLMALLLAIAGAVIVISASGDAPASDH